MFQVFFWANVRRFLDYVVLGLVRGLVHVVSLMGAIVGFEDLCVRVFDGFDVTLFCVHHFFLCRVFFWWS